MYTSSKVCGQYQWVVADISHYVVKELGHRWPSSLSKFMSMSANLVGQNCLTGMSCIVKKGILDDAGGLEALAVYLAEDFFMGKTILDRSAM